MDFCLDGYRSMLTKLDEFGYLAKNYDDFDSNSRHVLLRHDIDFSLDAAVIIASLEAELGWRAHYFILMRSDFYNPLSKRNRDHLSHILDMGHEIELHFDCTLYDDSMHGINEGACFELSVFEQIIGHKAKVISFHRPSESLLGNCSLVSGCIHTYMPSFFSDIGYCSDSQGQWRFGSPLEHDAILGGTALQLLTHPIWWAGQQHVTPTSNLEIFAENRVKQLRLDMAVNCKAYRPTETL